MLDSFYGGRPGSFFKLSGSFRYLYNPNYTNIVAAKIATDNNSRVGENGWLETVEGEAAGTQQTIYLVTTPGTFRNRFYMYVGDSIGEDTESDLEDGESTSPQNNTNTSEYEVVYKEIFDIGMLQAFALKQYYTGIGFGEYCIIDETPLVQGQVTRTLSPNHGKVYYRDYDFDKTSGNYGQEEDTRQILDEKTSEYRNAYGAIYIGNFVGPTGREIEDMRVVFLPNAAGDGDYYLQAKYNDSDNWKSLESPLVGLNKFIQAGTMVYALEKDPMLEVQDGGVDAKPITDSLWFHIDDNIYITKNPNNMSINASFPEAQTVVLYSANTESLPAGTEITVTWEYKNQNNQYVSIVSNGNPFTVTNDIDNKRVILTITRATDSDTLRNHISLYNKTQIRCRVLINNGTYPEIISKSATIFYS